MTDKHKRYISEIMEHHDKGLLLNKEVTVKTILALSLAGPSNAWSFVPEWVQSDIIRFFKNFEETSFETEEGDIIEISLNKEEREVMSWLSRNGML
jgi:hypothetical protein